MTLLSQWRPADSALGKFVRDVRRVLLGGEGGITWADNIGAVVKFREGAAILTSGAYLTTYPLTLRRPPHSVFLIRAKSTVGSEVICGGSVRWAWENNVLTVQSITGLTSGVTYDIELGVMMDSEGG